VKQGTRLQGFFPLSVQQARLWPFLRSNVQTYRTVYAIKMHGVWEGKRFKEAMEDVIAWHEILRTVFCSLPGMDLPIQVISDRALWFYAEIDLGQLTPAEQQCKIDEVFVALQGETHDVEHGPLLLTRVLSLQSRQQVLLVSLPALCADNASLKQLVDELFNSYNHCGPVEEIFQYADVSAWQEEQLAEEEAIQQRAYWSELPHKTVLKLPFQDEPQGGERQAHEAFAPQATTIEMPDILAQKIERQARKYETSTAAWLITCWKVLLWRLCDEAAFPVGVACDGRNYEELANALGPYTRFVPIEAHCEKECPFAIVLAAIQASLQEATKRQLYFTWESNQGAGGTKSHFFPVTFEYDRWPTAFEGEALTLSLLKRWSCTEPFLLKLSALQIGQRLQLDLYYDPQRFTTEQAGLLAGLLRTLLEQVTGQPQALIGRVSLLNSQERAYLRSAFSGPRRMWPDQVLHRLFEAQAQRWPRALAVISRQEQLTYQQLNEQANQLAQVLRRRGVGPNALVGLFLSRRASMLVGVLGILKAGGAYLPLDAGSPVALLSYQLQESRPMLLLTQEELRAQLPVWEGSTLSLEELAQELAESSPENQHTNVQEGDLAYMIYTAESTGAPKGVMISQRNLVNYTRALCKRLGAQKGWHYATVSTLAADLGNTAIFCALASGGCVQVLEYEQVTSAEAMADWARAHPIDVLKTVPSHLSALLQSESGKNFLPRQALVLGGEALPARLLERIAELDGRCIVYNHYGPTETTIGVLMQVLGVPQQWEDRGKDKERKIVLGRPIANVQVYVLDEHMQMVPQGVKGELYIGGAGVAWGYAGQGAQTAERFVPDPFGEHEGARLYRTGDLARYGLGGLIEFLGKADGQVKSGGTG
jgi:amino acid adenylation domain-containing protein